MCIVLGVKLILKEDVNFVPRVEYAIIYHSFPDDSFVINKS